MSRKKRPALAETLSPAPAFVGGVVSPPKSLVFISHDSRDAELAGAFSDLLTDVSAGILKSFRSSDRHGTEGIDFGAEWYKAIMEKLADATDVVALLTQNSIDRPWILYEAGVAKGRLDATVFGVAFGVPLAKAMTGPFGQFQNCGEDEDSLTKLVLQLLKRHPHADPREEAVRTQVKAFRQKMGPFLKAPTKPDAKPEPVDEPGIARLFEEVKVMFRDLPDQVEVKLKSAFRPSGLRRLRRFHPMMFEDMLFHPRLRETPDGAAVGWLLFISSFRDDLPWFYEIGLELYRALRLRNPLQITVAKRQVMASMELLGRGHWLEETMGPESRDLHMMFRHMPEMMEHFLARVGESLPTTRTKAVRKSESEGTNK